MTTTLALGGMTAREYMLARVRVAVGPNVPIAAVRFTQDERSTGVPVPAVLWATQGPSDIDTFVDGRYSPAAVSFELQCRSETIEGAQALARDILDALSPDGRLVGVPADFDEPDDPSQARGGYYARIVEVDVLEGPGA